jgi:transcription initiation factor TFIID subunit 11
MSGNRKRGADGAGGGIVKRRKGSIMSATSGTHPLRQTSFPPDEAYDMGARSPSVDAMSFVSGSQVSNAAPVKKKRGRKSKAEKARLEREQTPSLAAGKALSTAGGRSDAGAGRSSAPYGDDGGEEDENIELDKDLRMTVTEDVLTEKEKAEWREKEQLLKDNFSEQQQNRYEQQRAVALQKSTVRKLINATVSQSVPEPVVLAMRTIAKLYIGDMIEYARRIQSEWVDKLDEKQVEASDIDPSHLQLLTPEASPPSNSMAVDGEGENGQNRENTEESNMARLERLNRERRGPLRPDHLREAVRRHRISQEGGAVGLHDPWHQQQHSGVERFGTRTPGRRLFK